MTRFRTTRGTSALAILGTLALLIPSMGTASAGALLQTAPPITITVMEQKEWSTLGLIAEGGSIATTQVRFRIGASASSGNVSTIDLEVRPVGTAFSGWTSQTAVLAPSTVWQPNVTLAAGSYKWRVRASQGSAYTSWVEFGAPGNTDFITGSSSPTTGTLRITTLDQIENSSQTSINEGGNISTTTVQFRVTAMSGSTTGNITQMDLEVRPIGTAFTGVATQSVGLATSSFQWDRDVTLTNGSHHWRARVTTATGATTGWIEFGSPGNTDFSIGGATTPPPVPSTVTITSLEQMVSATGTALTEGTSTTATGIRFRAAATTNNGATLTNMEFEIRPTSQAFSGATNTVTASGTSFIGSLDSTLAANSYHWRVRSTNNAGVTSAWQEFGAAGNTDFTITGTPTPPPPTGPVTIGTMEQREWSTQALIPEGGSVSTTTVRFRTSASATSGNISIMELEVRPIGTAFTSWTHQTAVLAPSFTWQQDVTLAAGSYHWRVRASQGTTWTAWREFGNAGNTDFTLGAAAPVSPCNIIAMTQLENSTQTVIPEGGSITTTTVEFRANCTTGAGTTFTAVELEVRPIGSAFSGATQTFVPPGGQGYNLVQDLTFPTGGYRWRARATNNAGGTSGWIEFGAVAGNTDFTIGTPPPPATQQTFITQMEQRNGTTNALVGEGLTIASTIARLGVNANVINGGTLAQIEFEVRPVTQAFTGVATTTLNVAVATFAGTTDITLANGSYHWRARAVGSSGSNSGWIEFGVSGNTDFVMSGTTTPPPPTPTGDDHGNTPATATAITVNAPPIAGNIEIAGDVDYFSFAATSGVPYTMETSSLSSTMDTFLTLFDTNGTSPITQNDDISSANLASRIVWTAPATGTYYLRCRHFDATAIGTYAIAVTSATAPPPPPPTTSVTITGMRQLQTSTLTAIPEGGTITTTTVRFGVDATTTIGTLTSIQLEIRPIGTAFTGTPTQPSGQTQSTATFTMDVGLAAGGYHWRARAFNTNSENTGWIEFGTAGNTDFTLAPAPTTSTVTLTFMEQRNTTTNTVIAEGASTPNPTIRFTVTATTSAGTLSNIEMEYRPFGTAFTGTATAFSSASGTTYNWFINTSLAVGDHHWRARATNSLGATSGWVEFGAAGNIDLTVGTTVPPPPPPPPTTVVTLTGMGQADQLSGAAIAEGGSLTWNTVNFTMTAQTTGAALSLIELEVRPIATAFSGATQTVTPTTQTFNWTQSVFNPIGSYHWRARATDTAGATSGWIEFGAAGNTDFTVNSIPTAPVTITSMQQREDSTGTIIPEGGSISTTVVRFTVAAQTSNGSLSAIDLEVRPIATPFSAATAVANVSGTTFTLNVPLPQAAGSYHWRARARNSAGQDSGWQEMGTAGNTDFTINAVAPPQTIDVILSQFQASTLAAIAEGAVVTTSSVRLAGDLSTTAGTLTQIEVELKPMSQAFTGTSIATYTLGGAASTWFADYPLANDAYHWRVRVTTSTGMDSGWVEFGAAGNTDFAVNTSGTPPPPPPGTEGTASSGGSSGRRKGRCGLLGAEAALAFLLLQLIRKRK